MEPERTKVRRPSRQKTRTSAGESKGSRVNATGELGRRGAVRQQQHSISEFSAPSFSRAWSLAVFLGSLVRPSRRHCCCRFLPDRVPSQRRWASRCHSPPPLYSVIIFMQTGEHRPASFVLLSLGVFSLLSYISLLGYLNEFEGVYLSALDHLYIAYPSLGLFSVLPGSHAFLRSQAGAALHSARWNSQSRPRREERPLSVRSLSLSVSRVPSADPLQRWPRRIW